MTHETSVDGASTVTHSSFTIERTYPAPVARVFHAFADPATKRRWFTEGEGFEVLEFDVDFRTGGREFSRFRFGDGPEMTYDAQYMDIVPEQRIVFSYAMTSAGKPFSASLTTIELFAGAEGTRLTYTEYDAFLDTGDSALSREDGCKQLLERLAAELAAHS